MTMPHTFSTTAVAGFTLLAIAAGAHPSSLHRSLQSDSDHSQGFEQTVVGPSGLRTVDWRKSVQPAVTEMDASVAGHTTYQLEVTPVGKAESVYTIYGHPQAPLIMPPAFQVPAPFGSHTGGSPEVFWQFSKDCQFDSYLFAATATSLSSVGIDFAAWTATTGINAEDAAVFFTNPDDAPTGPAIVAQLTVPTGTSFIAQCGAQGHNGLDPEYQAALDPAHLSPGVDPSTVRQSWNQEVVTFEVAASSVAPAVLQSGH